MKSLEQKINLNRNLILNGISSLADWQVATMSGIRVFTSRTKNFKRTIRVGEGLRKRPSKKGTPERPETIVPLPHPFNKSLFNTLKWKNEMQ
jgi:hypothetical protein